MDASNVNNIAYGIIVFAVIIGFIYVLLEAMNHPRYRCDHPDHQDMEFHDEVSALGHQADMARHKVRRTDI